MPTGHAATPLRDSLAWERASPPPPNSLSVWTTCKRLGAVRGLLVLASPSAPDGNPPKQMSRGPKVSVWLFSRDEVPKRGHAAGPEVVEVTLSVIADLA